ncbi:hypothetical protein [Croceimicrobium hydrocarbonivorans]|uniref:Uncharacterized protein n=1 Tax=Croceimicrobium hydrocarbonivorans TaxID=2761580 RepID=A0A7H0VHD8_9FLAO|nr:hypothetical protein [Croceimicrobium hydrocarbonivorans]QNR25136.1 hypothetical protein H4K34_04675 [Croceimicrobium hydrocarbonivorans]
MDWKRLENTIHQFATEIDAKVEKRVISSIGYKAECYEFKDSADLYYRFQITKPRIELGSSFSIRSERPEKDIDIKARKWLFLGPRIKASPNPSRILSDLLRSLTDKLDQFTIQTDPFDLTFRTKLIDLDIDTLRLIRQIHLELKNNYADQITPTYH